MGSEEQLRIVKLIEIVNGIAGAELDSLNLLKVHKKYFLKRGGAASVLNPLERLL